MSTHPSEYLEALVTERVDWQRSIAQAVLGLRQRLAPRRGLDLLGVLLLGWWPGRGGAVRPAEGAGVLSSGLAGAAVAVVLIGGWFAALHPLTRSTIGSAAVPPSRPATLASLQVAEPIRLLLPQIALAQSGGRDLGALPPAPAGSSDPVLTPPQRRAAALLFEARRVFAATQGRVWPGYDISMIPLVVFEQGGEAIVVQHPQPPADYRRVAREEGWPTDVFVGPTRPEMNANTSGWLGEALCAFMDQSSLLTGAAHGGPIALVIHEGAHAFRGRAPQGGTDRWPAENPRLVSAYPIEDARNNAWGRIEGRLLAAALRVNEPDVVRVRCREFLSARRERQAHLPDGFARFERRLELNEGLAEYSAVAALRHADGYTPSLLAAGSGLSPQAFGPDGAYQRRLLDELEHLNVGGRGAARDRFYLTGAAQGLLLDRLSGSIWKSQVEHEGGELQDLLAQACGPAPLPAPAELARAVGFDDLLAAETHLARGAATGRWAQLQEILESATSFLVIDLAGAADGDPVRRFDPMNLITLEGTLRLHRRMVVLAFPGGEGRFQTPVIQDGEGGMALVPLSEPLRLEVDAQRCDLPRSGHVAGAVRLRNAALEIDASNLAIVQQDELVVVLPSMGADPDAEPDLERAFALLDSCSERAYEGSRSMTFRAAGELSEVIEIPDPQARETLLVLFSAAPFAAPSQRLVRALLDALEGRSLRPDTPRLVLIGSQCSRPEFETFVATLASPAGAHWIHDPERLLAQQLGVSRYPYVLHVDAKGEVLRRASTADAELLEELGELLGAQR